MKKALIKNARGVSLMELMGILTVLGVMVAATSGIVLKIVRDQTRSQFLNQLTLVGDTFRNSMADHRAWRETVNKNANLDCLKNLSDCNGKKGFITPYDSSGALLFNGYDPVANPDAGFDVHGNPCRGFNAAAPNGRCVARFTFEWSAICTGACTSPEVNVDFKLELAIPERSPLLPYPRLSNYQPTSLKRPGTPNMVAAGQMCNPKQVVVGFDKDGNIQCAATSAFPPPCTCPAKGGCKCSKGVCSCPGQCGKSCP